MQAREQKGIDRIQRLGNLKTKALLLGETDEVHEDASDSEDSVASEDSLPGAKPEYTTSKKWFYLYCMTSSHPRVLSRQEAPDTAHHAGSW